MLVTVHRMMASTYVLMLLVELQLLPIFNSYCFWERPVVILKQSLSPDALCPLAIHTRTLTFPVQNVTRKLLLRTDLTEYMTERSRTIFILHARNETKTSIQRNENIAKRKRKCLFRTDTTPPL